MRLRKLYLLGLIIFTLISCSNSKKLNTIGTEIKKDIDTTQTIAFIDKIDSINRITKERIQGIITNHSKLESKLIITKSIKKYEVKDEYERFDDVNIKLNNYKKLELNRYDDIIRIINESSETYFGRNIEIELNKNLKIQKVKYGEWTDYLTNELEIYFIVKSIVLKLNKNPFNSKEKIQGEYEMTVEKYLNGEFDKEFKYNAKFKSYKGLNKYERSWAEMQVKVLNGIIDENGVYQNLNLVDKKFVLLSNSSELLEKLKTIKKESNFEKYRISFSFVVNKKGLIEKESFMFRKDNPKELEKKVIELFINETKWKPAEVENVKVKAKGMYAF